jgi:glycosyltransferase 2 family protein
MPSTREAWQWITGSFWIRLAVSLGLLAAVLAQIDLRDAAERLADGRWWLFGAATLIFLVAFCLGAARWHLFLSAAAVPASARRTGEVYFAGVFANSVLPTNLGGDVVRTLLAGPPGTRSRSAATVIVDRVTVLGCALALGWAVALATMPPGELFVALAASTALYAAVVAVPIAAVLAGQRLRHRLPARLAASGEEGLRAARASLSGYRLGITTTALGLAYEALTVVALWLAARSVDVDVSFSAMAVMLPPMLLLAALPISIGGFGVREISYVALLDPFGISATEATLVSLLGQAAFMLATLPGAFVLLRRSGAGVGRSLETRLDRD